ncbi:hypothetical protein MYCTH_2303524 [Thermothelomyces thermophilus ATCC 42464]|uniref:Uncharacterized protein n=1 Tax=Thermothelomyces thermophilus (strain ATCC 42464 / BCRC 31852 / DSM 1799) TaxID=573729 RepID=G2QCY0_THET4|nr:uncharacterized protein MYCTH_2303524 [Thermothelomyces thermophilus ATCC 42464]AEO57400.1 hypothetical protein MYCTH_2303524 [Thermothelomyces thermophilus ATCC 42464]
MSVRRQIDRLPNVVNDVLVTTAKAFKAARRDGKANPAAAAAAIESRIPDAVERFNAILDDVESDILLAKAVLERDLKVVRAKRQQPPPGQKAVAPPAPMAVDLESPKMAAKEPVTGLPGPPPSGTPTSGGQANKPVAPFPNMGFESTTPEAAGVPSPKAVPQPNISKNLVRPGGTALAAAAAARPASAPPKKDVKVSPPQTNRPGGVATAPQTPLNPSAQQVKPSSTPVGPNRQTPNLTPGNAGGVAAPVSAAPVSAAPALTAPASTAPASSAPAPTTPVPTAPAPTASAAGNGSLFTDMTFSVAPPLNDSQPQKPAPQPQRRESQQQSAPPRTDDANAGAESVPAPKAEQSTGAPADVASTDAGVRDAKNAEDNSMANIDDSIDGLFDLGPGGMDSMDMEYDLSNGDNSNFNDMYFGTGDNSGGSGEFDDAFFNLNG